MFAHEQGGCGLRVNGAGLLHHLGHALIETAQYSEISERQGYPGGLLGSWESLGMLIQPVGEVRDGDT